MTATNPNRKKRFEIPGTVWGVFNPEKKLTNLYLGKPKISVLAWAWMVVQPDSSGNSIELPADLIAARKAGYRLRPLRLSLPKPKR